MATDLQTGQARICAVIGHPVAHSLSPALHRAAYAALGLDWAYECHDVAPEQLARFVAGLDGRWRGLSVTMPHKAAIRHFGASDELVDLVGVGNTLVLDVHGNQVHNTDVSAVMNIVASLGLKQVGTAVLLGAGATARSVLVGLSQIGLRQAQILVRDPAKAGVLKPLADRLGVQLSADQLGCTPTRSELLVCTLPSGANRPYVASVLDAAPAVLDVVYDPWPGPLVSAAQDAGLVTANGLDFLAAQAVDQIRWFTGQQVPVDLLVSAGQAELQARLLH